MAAKQSIYICRNNHAWNTSGGGTCPKCGDVWRKRTSYTPVVNPSVRNEPHFHAYTFKPYVEEGFDGTPKRLESRHQRDHLCDEHGLTYDRYSSVRRPEITPAIDTIDYGDVKEALEHGPRSFVEPDLPYFEPEREAEKAAKTRGS